jgi:hypothetical protein
VIDDQEQPVDLALLKPELERRAARVTERVLGRMASLRERERHRAEVREGVRRRLARFALPGALAAALSFLAILATRKEASPPPEVFALMVMGQTPAARWVALGEPPGIAELLQAMRGQ